MTDPGWLVVLGLLLAANLGTFALFGRDKARARSQGRRISEGSLLAAAFLGGFIGAKIGQRHFRHKTRKQPFGRLLNAIGLFHAGLLVLVLAVT